MATRLQGASRQGLLYYSTGVTEKGYLKKHQARQKETCSENFPAVEVEVENVSDEDGSTQTVQHRRFNVDASLGGRWRGGAFCGPATSASQSTGMSSGGLGVGYRGLWHSRCFHGFCCIYLCACPSDSLTDLIVQDRGCLPEAHGDGHQRHLLFEACLWMERKVGVFWEGKKKRFI